MTKAHREVERKLRVPGDFTIPPLAEAVPSLASAELEAPFTMRNTYFDTADLRLFRWGVTLRRRQGGPDEGWHMKLPVEGADGTTRDEVRLPVEGDAVPREFQALVTALVRGAPLGPIATLRAERRPQLLRDQSGTIVAELVDDTVTVLDGEREVTTFREIEVEAVTDPGADVDMSVLDEVVGTLIGLGAEPGGLSKAAAALGPRTLAPPDVPEPTWPSAADAAGDAVRAYLATHVRRFLLQDVRVRRGLPDSVHQLRVAARRLRSGLQSYRALVDREWAQHLRTELAWAASGLGLARDTEVLRERLHAGADALPPEDRARASAVVDAALAECERDAEAMVAETMGSERYLALLEALVAAARDPLLSAEASEPCDKALPRLVRKAFRRLAKDVEALQPDAPSEQWHETRIAGKKARYAADAAAPVLRDRVTPLAQQLSRVTDVLGSHQDAHVAQSTVREIADAADGVDAFALGLLYDQEVEAEMAARSEFLALWPEVLRTAQRSRLA